MILSIDLGSSKCKALTVNSKGEVFSEEEARYDQDFSTEAWKKELIKVLEQVIYPEKIDAIAITGLGGAFFTLSDQGKPVSTPFPAFMRSQADEFPTDISNLKGGSWMMYHNLLWLKKNQPRKFAASEKAIDARDYIAYLLTGEIKRNSFGLSQARAEELNQRFDIPDAIFPDTSTYREPIGSTSGQLAEDLGLKNIPLFVCPWDEICGAIGARAIEEGDTYFMAGTTGIAGACVREGNRNHPIENIDIYSKYSPIGMMHRKILEESEYSSFTQLDLEAQKINEKIFSHGKLENQISRLKSAAKKTKAVYEADAELLKKVLRHPEAGSEEVIVGGGRARSNYWNKLIEKETEHKIKQVQTLKLAALGAAVITASSAGIHPSITEAAEKMVSCSRNEN